MTGGSDWTAKFGAFTYHGGALEVARRLASQAPEPWIDLSTAINPHAYPLPALAPEAWSRLPESGAVAKLEAAAAFRYRAPAGAVVAGPGSQALIHALSLILPRGSVGALGPTYGGFATAFAAAGARVVEAKRLEDMGNLDVAIVVNPNNPDGRIIPRAGLLDLHERLARRGGVLIVDEAFADFAPLAREFMPGPPRRVSSPTRAARARARAQAPVGEDQGVSEESLAPMLPASGAVVLRSFGKTYGLAGLRLGFALASADIVGGLRAALGPWPISGPAIAIGTRALSDSRWLDATRGRLDKDRVRLDALLESARWRILGGTLLFRLAAHEDARGAFERLLAAGILVRPFAGAPDRLRFGIPGDESGWERLGTALQG